MGDVTSNIIETEQNLEPRTGQQSGTILAESGLEPLGKSLFDR